MSIAASIRSQLVPIHPEGYPFIGAFALATLILFWLWPPLGWIGTVLTRLVRLFLPRSAARDADARRPRGRAGGRPHQHGDAGVPPPELGLGDTAAAPRLDFHERVRLPHQPQPGRRPHRAHRSITPASSSTPISTRRARTTSAIRFVIATPAAAHRAWCRSPAWWRAASSASSREGQSVGAGRAHRHDPLRLARRRLSAGGRAAAGGARDRPRSRAKRCSPICAPRCADADFRVG